MANILSPLSRLTRQFISHDLFDMDYDSLDNRGKQQVRANINALNNVETIELIGRVLEAQRPLVPSVVP